MMWRETYTYDANGNRATKTTPWGTIEYEYDEENRLIRRGDIEYINDMDGNVLSERGLRYEAHYEYNGQNRMTYSEVTSHADRTHAVSFYAYDALGRRTLTESITGQVLRTVYEGMGFEAIREGETFRDGSLTTQFSNSVTTRAAPLQSNQPTGERYRWISEDYNGGSAVTEDGYTIEGSRYGTRGVTLYGNGEAVAVSYSSSASSRSVYLGKDILGSVRTATADGGAVEDRYEYDAFGQVYKGDLSGGMNLGYTGKPYDAGTGLYNYGYRDYRPEAARFTTVDPIRDGSNWYAYVNNDPVNWVDPWGLETVYSYQETYRETTSEQKRIGDGFIPFVTTNTYTTTYYSTNRSLLDEYLNDNGTTLSEPIGINRAIPNDLSRELRDDRVVIVYLVNEQRTKVEIMGKDRNGNWRYSA
jgi:RHS repeat-associated protein